MDASWRFNAAWLLSFCTAHGNHKIFSRYNSENLQATRLPLQSMTREVSSVVERLVYTEFQWVLALLFVNRIFVVFSYDKARYARYLT